MHRTEDHRAVYLSQAALMACETGTNLSAIDVLFEEGNEYPRMLFIHQKPFVTACKANDGRPSLLVIDRFAKWGINMDGWEGLLVEGSLAMLRVERMLAPTPPPSPGLLFCKTPELIDEREMLKDVRDIKGIKDNKVNLYDKKQKRPL